MGRVHPVFTPIDWVLDEVSAYGDQFSPQVAARTVRGPRPYRAASGAKVAGRFTNRPYTVVRTLATLGRSGAGVPRSRRVELRPRLALRDRSGWSLSALCEPLATESRRTVTGRFTNRPYTVVRALAT